MRLLTGLAAVLFCVAGTIHAEDTAPGDAASDSAKATVEFNGETLTLAWEDKDVFGDTIKEFIPADQTLDNWTRLAAAFEYPKIDDPREFAEGMVEQLTKDNPKTEYELLVNSESGEVILDFVAYPEDGSYAEFDVFQYRKKDGGGLVAYQYALRAYGDAKEQFVTALDAEHRAKLIVALVEGAAKIREQATEGESETAATETE